MTAQLRSGSIPAFCEQVTSGPKAARPTADTLVAQDHVAIGCVPPSWNTSDDVRMRG